MRKLPQKAWSINQDGIYSHVVRVYQDEDGDSVWYEKNNDGSIDWSCNYVQSEVFATFTEAKRELLDQIQARIDEWKYAKQVAKRVKRRDIKEPNLKKFE